MSNIKVGEYHLDGKTVFVIGVNGINKDIVYRDKDNKICRLGSSCSSRFLNADVPFQIKELQDKVKFLVSAINFSSKKTTFHFEDHDAIENFASINKELKGNKNEKQHKN